MAAGSEARLCCCSPSSAVMGEMRAKGRDAGDVAGAAGRGAAVVIGEPEAIPESCDDSASDGVVGPASASPVVPLWRFRGGLRAADDTR